MTRRLQSFYPLDDEKLNQNFDLIRTTLNDYEDVEVTTPASANTDFQVLHKLGRPVAGVVPIKKSAACDLYFSNINADNRNTNQGVWLRATVASVVVTLRLY